MSNRFPVSVDRPSVRVLTREDLDVLVDAQHSIAVSARLLWHVLETHARPNAETTYDATMHEGLLALVTEITTAAAALEPLARPQ